MSALKTREYCPAAGAISNEPGLSVGRQCALLWISRSSSDYGPKRESDLNLELMCPIDKQFLETPFDAADGRSSGK